MISSAPTRRRKTRSSLIQVWPAIRFTVRSTTSTCGVAAGPGISPKTYLKKPTFNQPRPATTSSNGPYLARCFIPSSTTTSRAMPTVANPFPVFRAMPYHSSLIPRTASGKPSALDQPHDAAPKYTNATSSPPSRGADARKGLSSLDWSSHVTLITGFGRNPPRPNTKPNTNPTAAAPRYAPFVTFFTVPPGQRHVSRSGERGQCSLRHTGSCSFPSPG